MTYARFEDLPCWQSAVDLVLRIRALTKDGLFSGLGDLGDQLRRAALSISNNIAEGFERGSTAELLAFLYIARGSAGEVRSMRRVCERCPDAAHLQPDLTQATALAESCSRQIRAWASSLQNSDIKGCGTSTTRRANVSRNAHRRRSLSWSWRAGCTGRIRASIAIQTRRKASCPLVQGQNSLRRYQMSGLISRI